MHLLSLQGYMYESNLHNSIIEQINAKWILVVGGNAFCSKELTYSSSYLIQFSQVSKIDEHYATFKVKLLEN